MPKKTRTRTIFLCLVLSAAAVSAGAAFRPQSGAAGSWQEGRRVGRLPVVDYDAAAPGDAHRNGKSARFNKRGSEPITELPAGIEQLPVNSHWWSGLPALPVAQSRTVVVGKVADARAFMSADKTDVYSEFTVSIEDVLKGGAGLAAGDSLTVDRRGGGVRFSSGRVQRHVIAYKHLPAVGARYVLFLTAEGDGSDYTILTGYELHEGKVSPLDGPDVYEESARLPFSAYEGRSEAELLRAVRAAVATGGGGETAKGEVDQ